jgi:hypothetical protein
MSTSPLHDGLFKLGAVLGVVAAGFLAEDLVTAYGAQGRDLAVQVLMLSAYSGVTDLARDFDFPFRTDFLSRKCAEKRTLLQLDNLS